MSKVTIITNQKNWVEHTAITQLNALANLNGVVQAIGLPDLHAGKTPIGVAVVTDDVIYPHIIGNDIGCGMGLFKTGVSHKKFKLERWETRLNHIRELGDIPTSNPYDEPSPIYDLGTIGGGNHFAEFQILDKVYYENTFEQIGFDVNDVMLLIHSGSRGYGQSLLREFDNPNGLEADSPEGIAYMEKHNHALLWAERNRVVVANKLIDFLGFATPIESIIDCKHNFLGKRGNQYIHRKGAVSSEVGSVIIPGSRGSLTYIVNPTDKTSQHAYSLSHGAGRKWARSLCKSRIRDKYDRDTIRDTKFKSRVVCHDTELLFQEAPEAYKNIETVIACLLEFGLIEIIATLKPVLTYKG